MFQAMRKSRQEQVLSAQAVAFAVPREAIQLSLYDCCRTVNPFSHICVPGYKIHIHILRKLLQHDCKACSTRARVAPLTFAGKEIFICSVVISILPEEWVGS